MSESHREPPKGESERWSKDPRGQSYLRLGVKAARRGGRIGGGRFANAKKIPGGARSWKRVYYTPPGVKRKNFAHGKVTTGPSTEKRAPEGLSTNDVRNAIFQNRRGANKGLAKLGTASAQTLSPRKMASA